MDTSINSDMELIPKIGSGTNTTKAKGDNTMIRSSKTSSNVEIK